MAVSFETSLPAGYTQSSTSTAAAKTSVDYDSFLKLLITQMKNQDPTSPTDSTEYIAQIAQFSQVEQSVNMNSKLDQMMQQTSLSQATDLIGHTVTSADGETSGIVKQVKMTSGGLTAITEAGDQISIINGVQVS